MSWDQQVLFVPLFSPFDLYLMEFSNAVDRLHLALKQIFEQKAKKNPQKKSWSTASLIPW